MVWMPKNKGPEKLSFVLELNEIEINEINTQVTKIFSRDTNMLPQRHQLSNIFEPSPLPQHHHERASCVAKLSRHKRYENDMHEKRLDVPLFRD